MCRIHQQAIDRVTPLTNEFGHKRNQLEDIIARKSLKSEFERVDPGVLFIEGTAVTAPHLFRSCQIDSFERESIGDQDRPFPVARNSCRHVSHHAMVNDPCGGR